MNYLHKLAIIASSLGVAVFGIRSAEAADWNWDPRATISGNYDDNYGLDSGNSRNVSVAGGIVDALLHLHIADRRTQFDIQPKIRSVYYPNHSEYQANDQFVDSRFEHDWQSANFAMGASYWRQDILRSYLPGTTIGTPLGQTGGGADIGAIQTKIRQDFLLITPTATFDLSPRQRLEFQTNYLDIKYSKQILNERQDFKSFGGGVGFEFGVTPRSTVTLRGVASQLKPASGSNANNYGIESEWKTKTSEVTQAYARIGVNRTTFDAVQYGQSSATSVSGGLGLARKFQRSDLFADILRSVSPNSAGAVVARDELRVRFERKLGLRTSGYLGLRGIKESALGSTVGFTGQRYGTASVGYEWRVLREFSIVSEYAYTTRKDDLTPRASSNAATISFVYEPHRPEKEFGVRIGNY